MNKYKVAVYGTLRSGQSANHMVAGGKFLGTVRIPSGSLYDTGWYPAWKSEGTTGVMVEVYEVTSEQVEIMDGYEGHPHLFRRCQIDTVLGDCFIYEYQGDIEKGVAVLEHGDWTRDRQKVS